MSQTAAPGSFEIRDARAEDLPAIVRLLADDPLGQTREHVADPLPAAYGQAFAAIEADPRHRLVVAWQDGRVVACLQLSFLPHLTHQGGERAQIEGVRVDHRLRGVGLGRTLLAFAIEQARARGCRMVQLTTDRTRPEALRFYEDLGFRHSHAGMKLPLG